MVSHVLYATNNASRVPAEVADHLRRLGAPARDADVVTSAEAGAAIVAERVPAGGSGARARRRGRLVGPGPGGPATRGTLRDHVGARGRSDGDRPGPSQAAGPGGERVAAVLQGLGRQLTVADFEVAARLIGEGAVWVVTNGDTTLPLQWGTAPGNGAYVDLLRTATEHEPVAVAGKPESPLYDLAVDRLGTDRRRTLAVGDRLDTDIAGARAAGLDSVWVLTGVDRPSALLETDLDPTFVVASRRRPPAPVCRPVGPRGHLAVCVGDRSSRGRHPARRRGDAEPIEALRAGLAALLDLRDRATEVAGGQSAGASSGPSGSDVLRAGGAVLDDLVAPRAGS